MEDIEVSFKTVDSDKPKKNTNWVMSVSTHPKCSFSVLWGKPTDAKKIYKHIWKGGWNWCSGNQCETCRENQRQAFYHGIVYVEQGTDHFNDSGCMTVFQASETLWRLIVEQLSKLKVSVGPNSTFRIKKVGKTITVEPATWGDLDYKEITRATEAADKAWTANMDGKRMSKTIGGSK